MTQRLALYRKWRPLTFSQVAGQEHVTRTLLQQVETGRISHAYLFTGTRGTGKTSCAKILARAVCCTDPREGNPCNQCPACLSVLDESALDVTEIDAASNNGVDNIRELRDEAFFAPSSLRYRVYIIDEVHMLSPGAFNALLKILEEPPAHVLFILATTELHKVPSTILSRCQRYDFRRIPAEVIAAHLTSVAQQEGYGLEPDAAALLARLGDGSIRDAISLLDRSLPGEGIIDRNQVTAALGLVPFESLTSLLDALLAGDAGTALEIFTSCYLSGQDLVSIFDELLSLIRDIYVVQAAGPDAFLLSSADPQLLSRYSQRWKGDLLEYFIECVSDMLRRLTRTAIKRTDAEMCLLKMALRHAQPLVIQQPSAQQPAAPVSTAAKPPMAEKPQEDVAPWEEASAPASGDSPVPAAPPVETELTPPLPSAAPPAAQPQGSSPSGAGLPGDWKGRLMAAVSPRVNSAVRTYLSLADVENLDNILHVSVLEESLIFMEKPAVIRILEEGAKELSCSGVRLRSKAAGDSKAPAPKSAPPAAKSAPPAAKAETPSPADEILNRARAMGIQINS